MAGRLNRYQEKLLTKKILILTIASLAVLIMVILFGFRILVGFSLIIDKIQQNPKDKPPTQDQSMLLPPALDWIPEATNSAEIIISGSAYKDSDIYVYINDAEADKIKTDSEGKFSALITIKNGENIIVAKQKTDNNFSGYSNELKVSMIKKEPELEIINPENDSLKTGDDPVVDVAGITDSQNRVTVNGRLAVVKTDGTFNYSYKLTEGENIIVVEAIDMAGNVKNEEIKIRYER